MPSPRAVLADIHNLSLDPNKSWSTLAKNGRLKGPSTAVAGMHAPAEVREEPPLVHQEVIDQEVVQDNFETAFDLKEEVSFETNDFDVQEVDQESAESISLEQMGSADSNSEIDFRPKKKKK